MAKSFHVFQGLQQAGRYLFGAADSLSRARDGLLSAHQVILMVLMRADGLKASDIADRTGLSRSRLTGLIDTLQARGFVRRGSDSQDGRVRRIYIEPEGTAMAKQSARWVKKIDAALLEPFSAAERDTIEQFLAHVEATSKTLHLPRG